MLPLGLLLNIISLFILCLWRFCYGYDKILYFQDWDCSETYNIHDMTQYEKYLVYWNGHPFKFWCATGFIGKNPKNVDTSYRVCVRVVKKYFENCIPKLELYDGVTALWATKTFDCHNTFPDKWCSKGDYLGVKVIAEELSGSYIELEVSVEADISLSIAAAIGLAVGIVVCIILLCCCCMYSAHKKEKQNSQSLENRENLLPDNIDYRHRVHEPNIRSNSADIQETNMQMQPELTLADSNNTQVTFHRRNPVIPSAPPEQIPILSPSHTNSNDILKQQKLQMAVSSSTPLTSNTEDEPPSYDSLFCKS